ncbi:MAG: competence protein ComEA [Bacillota bacterium]|jgi:competence protein ComEA|nr:competence protein ComEA [Bacillota bacterium]
MRVGNLTRTQQYLLFGLAGVLIVVASFFYWHRAAGQEAVVIEPPPAGPTAPSTTEGAPGAEAGEAEKSAEVVVHVAGAVAKSGVYRLPAGSRVIDAVEAAGGAAAEADVDALNLAQPLVDGQKVWVPKKGEVTVTGAAGTATGPAAGSAAAGGGKVNINTAGVAELDTLPGIGPALAQRIIDYRAAHGPFKSIEDLKNVSGIGEKKFAEIKDYVTLY